MPHIESSPVRRWSREHWVLASLFVFLGILIVTIVPGFASAMRSAEARDRTTLSLPLPPLAGNAAGVAAGSAWQIVRVQSGQTLGAVFQQLGVPPKAVITACRKPRSSG